MEWTLYYRNDQIITHMVMDFSSGKSESYTVVSDVDSSPISSNQSWGRFCINRSIRSLHSLRSKKCQHRNNTSIVADAPRLTMEIPLDRNMSSPPSHLQIQLNHMHKWEYKYTEKCGVFANNYAFDAKQDSSTCTHRTWRKSAIERGSMESIGFQSTSTF